MKLIKKKTFWVAIVITVIIVVAIIYQTGNPKQEELVTIRVEKGNLAQTVSATGKVESATGTDLNFTLSGKLQRLYIKAGQQVKAGQLLGQLESAQAASKVAAAQAQVAEAQADLDRVKAGASLEDVEVSHKSVGSAQATLAAAQTALINAKATRDQGIINLKDDLLNTLSDSFFSAKEAMDTVDDIISSTYKRYLGNINPNTYNKVYSNYPLTESLLIDRENIFMQYSVDNSKEELIDLGGQLLEVLEGVENLVNNTYSMLIKTVPAGSLTQTQIDTFKSNIETEQAGIATKISAVQSAKGGLESDILSYQTDVDAAQAKVEQAEKDLALARAQLNLKEADPRDFEVDYYQAKLLSARANLQSSQADLANYSLKAPIEGLITKINYEIGEYVSSAQPLISLISESNLEIQVDVPESDIAKINMGDQVEITLDAFGDEQIFSGHLTFIDPAETIINDVVYYQVKAAFDQNDEKVKSGMTANVTVSTARRNDALYIPTRAVIEKDGQIIVRVLVNKQKQEREVVTGLRADEGMIEIISGLEEGETVITYIKNGK